VGIDQARKQHRAGAPGNPRVLLRVLLSGAGGLDRGDRSAVDHDVMQAVQDAIAVEDANVREDLLHLHPPDTPSTNCYML
jgi:hypothetical protein